MDNCRYCGSELESFEKIHYASSCETCEQSNNEMLNRWRDGEKNEMLDRLFGMPAVVAH